MVCNSGFSLNYNDAFPHSGLVHENNITCKNTHKVIDPGNFKVEVLRLFLQSQNKHALSFPTVDFILPPSPPWFIFLI